MSSLVDSTRPKKESGSLLNIGQEILKLNTKKKNNKWEKNRSKHLRIYFKHKNSNVFKVKGWRRYALLTLIKKSCSNHTNFCQSRLRTREIISGEEDITSWPKKPSILKEDITICMLFLVSTYEECQNTWRLNNIWTNTEISREISKYFHLSENKNTMYKNV